MLLPDNTPELTPIGYYGDIAVKRDDSYMIAGVSGGKARTCWALAQGARGLVTAGSRFSPQVNIVAHIARRLGIPCHVHTPQGELSPEVQAAVNAGAKLFQHRAGYNSVIIARARADARLTGWREIPFGMECEEAVRQSAKQVANVPAEARRIVIPVGSGMSLAGILHGLKERGLNIPVLGVIVGADPVKRLDKFAPPDWRDRTFLIKAASSYHDSDTGKLRGLTLDPYYESKCLPYLRAGDLFWLVGLRQTAFTEVYSYE